MKAVFLPLFLLAACLHVYGQNKLEATGNAGIGTTTPTEKLEISSAGLSTIKLTHTSDVLGTVGTIKFNMAGTDVGRLEVERNIPSAKRSVMKFFIKGDSLQEAMRINYTGFVGIGEQSPGATLHVAGKPGNLLAKFTQTNVPSVDGYTVVSNGTNSTERFIPCIIGRAYTPGRSFGLYLVGEADDAISANEPFFVAMILDGRTRTNGKLTTNNVLAVNSNSINLMLVKADGSVGIGTTDTKGYKLAVNGNGIFTRVVVKTYNNWPDFVFSPGYQLPSLAELSRYVDEHRHLPDMPSAGDVEQDGIDLGEMNKKLLQKIEELTLYIIDMKKESLQQQERIEKLEKERQ
jgi:hypothetical protein